MQDQSSPRSTLNRDERDTLWRDAAESMQGDFNDVVGCLEEGSGDDARRSAHSFRVAMRLLDDLGWDEIDPRETYELTMPEDELRRVLQEMLETAEDCLRVEARSFDRSHFCPMTDEEWTDTRRGLAGWSTTTSTCAPSASPS